MEPADDFHFRREDRGLRWKRLAVHLSACPADFHVALGNIDRWEKSGRVHPAPLIEWRERILAALASPAAMDSLIRFMETPNHDSEPIKSCSPFVGILEEHVLP
jgi:hypothetical protein